MEKKGISKTGWVIIGSLLFFGILGSLVPEQEAEKPAPKDKCLFKTARVEVFNSLTGEQILGQDINDCFALDTKGRTSEVKGKRGALLVSYDNSDLTNASDSYLQSLTLKVGDQPAETLRTSNGAVIRTKVNPNGMEFTFSSGGQRGKISYTY